MSVLALGKETRFVEELVLGQWQTNCYILGDLALDRAVVVDPGQDGGPAVQERLAARGVTCEAILLTHAHVDHMWAVPELARALDVPVFLHPGDRWLWNDPGGSFGVPLSSLRTHLGLEWDPPTERLEELDDYQSLSFAGFSLLVRHSPGHTPGSSVFLLNDTGADDPVLLSGDLLFAGSVGRTDLPGGSWMDQLESLMRIVLPLDDRTVVLPGHGPRTTVGAERTSNRYLGPL